MDTTLLILLPSSATEANAACMTVRATDRPHLEVTLADIGGRVLTDDHDTMLDFVAEWSYGTVPFFVPKGTINALFPVA